MKTFTVKELMVPLAEYATVSEDATLFDAIQALEKAQAEFDQTRYRHRAVLILNSEDKVVGKLSQLDALKALEPKYKNLQNEGSGRHFGFSPTYTKGMLNQFSLWASPLTDLCKKALARKVKEFMYELGEGEFVREDATFDVAINQLIMGQHQSLLVTNHADDIVGILRLTDVFAAVFQTMANECRPQDM
jgi:CBS domain containing-hemolysin-like protein